MAETVNLWEMEQAAMDEWSVAQLAAQAAGSAEMMEAGKQRLRERLAELEPVKEAERAEERARYAERERARQEYDAQIVASVPDCDAVYDAARMLALLRSIEVDGFMDNEADYLRDILEIIRKPAP